jgi:hypothetical protein
MKKLAMMTSLITLISSGKLLAQSADKMICENIGPSITRCSNKEVICYVRNNGGIFCKFKEKK